MDPKTHDNQGRRQEDGILRGAREFWMESVAVVLASILRPVRNHPRLAVMLFAVVLALFSYHAISGSYSYVARASVLLSPPAYQTKGPASELLPSVLDIPSYAGLMTEPAILEEVCTRLVAERPELWNKLQENGVLVPEVVERWVDVETEVVEKTPQNVRYSNVIRLSGRGSTAERARHLTETWVQVCVTRVREFSEPGTRLTIEFIRDEFEKAKEELEKREDDLARHQRENDIEFLRGLLMEYRGKIHDYEVELVQTEVDLAVAREQLAETELLLAEEERKITLKRSPSNDAYVIGRSVGGAQATPMPVFEDEILNAVWEKLRREQTDLRSKLKGLEARQEQILAQIDKMETDMEILRAQIIEAQLLEDRLLRRVSNSKGYYSLLAKQHEDVVALEANLKMEQSSVIVVANAPVLPGRPSNFLVRWANIPLGLVIALLAAVAGANLWVEAGRVRFLMSKPLPESQTDAKASEQTK